MKPRYMALALGLCVLFFPLSSHAQWWPNGVALATSVFPYTGPWVVSDGSAGAIAMWSDTRNHTDHKLYMQRIDASGVVQWTSNGIAVCTAAGNQSDGGIVADGSGGAIAAWSDNRTSLDAQIYAQRIDATGTVQWGASGVPVCTAAGDQLLPFIVSDGSGGAVVAWRDYRNGNTNADVYAQRIDATGAVQWTANGVALCTAINSQIVNDIVSDGSGGAIVGWTDFRRGAYFDSTDVYVQRVDGSGSPQWTTDGAPLCTAPWGQLGPGLASDGAGGAIGVWQDKRNGTDYNMYAQRVDASGAMQWTTDGVALCTAADYQVGNSIVADGSGGAIAVWNDRRNGTDFNVYAQRIDASGSVQWATDGVALCTAPLDQSSASMVSDGAGGAIVFWNDDRNGTDYDVYTQRVDAAGAVQWTTDGVRLCNLAYDQIAGWEVSDGSGGAIVAWRDQYYSGIFAQTVASDGSVPTAVGDTPSYSTLHLSPATPNPFSSGTSLELDLAAAAQVEVDVYDVMGRRVRRIEASREAAGSHRMDFDGRDDNGRPLASGVYFYRVTAQGVTVTRKMVIAR